MKLKDILKAQGLTDDQVQKVLDAMKENSIYTASEENLDIRYGKLKTDFDALTQKDTESQNLITQLQNATKDQEGVQQQITEYQTRVQELETELTRTQTESALKVALLAAGAKSDDIEYLIFKMSNDPDWKPELDKSGNIKGIDEKLTGLKTQYPSQFESTAGGNNGKVIEPNNLPKGNSEKTVTRDQFLKMGYTERLALKNSDPEQYRRLSH